MKIDKETQLFRELSDYEAEELQLYAHNAVVHGVYFPYPEAVTQWANELEYTSDQMLSLISTRVPQFILLSLLYHEQNRPLTTEDRYNMLAERFGTACADGWMKR